MIAFIHLLYAALGIVLVRWCTGSTRVFALGRPDWIAAYFLGLALNTMAAFVANQFLGMPTTTGPLYVIAAGLLVAAVVSSRAAPQRLENEEESPPPNSEPSWIPWLLVVVVGLLFWRHSRMLWTPMADWDSFLYHLPFGESIADGGFPAAIGSSYNRQMEAAYPPLFFFLYGLNALFRFGDLTFLAPKLTVFVINAATCAMTYFLGRDRLRLPSHVCWIAAAGVAAAINVDPNVQSLTTLYFLLGLYYAWPWVRGGASRPRVVALGAVFLAGCYWTNYVGVFLIALLALGYLASGIRELRDPTRRLWPLLLTAGVVAGCTAPHLARNWIVAGNPVYPAFLDLLGGVGATDWFLANRTINVPAPLGWRDLPLRFTGGVPYSTLILAGLAALANAQRLRGLRVFFGVIVAGYCLVWIGFLQVTFTPVHRFLLPVVPLCVLLVAAWLDQARDSSIGEKLQVAAFASVFVILNLYPHVGWALLLAVGVVFIVIMPLVGAWLSAGQAPRASSGTGMLGTLLALVAMVGMSVQGQEWSYELEYVALAVVALCGGWLVQLGLRRVASGLARWLPHAGTLVVLVVVVTVLHHDADGCCKPDLPILADLEWMNENLPPEAVVLTLEDRLFLLQREFYPADDYRLEGFYEAESPEESLNHLRRQGITHVYLSGSFYYDYPPFGRRGWLLWPGRSPFVRTIYENEGRMVAAVDYERVPATLAD